MCSRGARLGHPMDPVVSVQNKNFSANTKELAKALGAEKEAPNHETITGTLSLFKILPLDGFNLIRAKERLHRRRKRVHESFSSRRTSQKLFFRTIHWNCENPVKIYHGVIERLHLIETNGFAERAVRRIKEGTSAILLQSGLDEQIGRLPWSVTAICETFKTSYLMGRRPTKDVLENHSKGPIIPFGSIIENHPISAKDLSRLHQFRKKVLPGIIPRICLVCGGNQERRHVGRRHWEVWKDGRSRRPRWETQCKGSDDAPKWWFFSFPISDGKVKLSEGDQVLRTSTLMQDSSWDEEEEREGLRGESDGSPPPQDSLPGDGEARNDFWSISRN